MTGQARPSPRTVGRVACGTGGISPCALRRSAPGEQGRGRSEWCRPRGRLCTKHPALRGTPGTASTRSSPRPQRASSHQPGDPRRTRHTQRSWMHATGRTSQGWGVRATTVRRLIDSRVSHPSPPGIPGPPSRARARSGFRITNEDGRIVASGRSSTRHLGRSSALCPAAVPSSHLRVEPVAPSAASGQWNVIRHG